MKKTAVLLYPQFSEYELSVALSILMQGGKPVVTVGINNQPIKGESGLTCLPDTTIDEVNGDEKKYKDKIAGYETEKGKFTAKISELEKTLEKNSSDKEASKEYWKAQFEGELKKRDEDNAKIASERDFFKKSHYERLQKDAIEEGIKDINFIDGLKNGFIATVMMQNHFEPTDIDGKVMFLNSEQKTIQEVVKNFATTTEGKAYIKNPSSGGGARGSSHTYQQGGTVMSRADFDNLNKTNPQARTRTRILMACGAGVHKVIPCLMQRSVCSRTRQRQAVQPVPTLMRNVGRRSTTRLNQAMWCSFSSVTTILAESIRTRSVA